MVRRKTDAERKEYPSGRSGNRKTGSDNYIKNDRSAIIHKRSDDDTPDSRYRDNDNVKGERPTGSRGAKPPKTPKEQAKQKRINGNQSKPTTTNSPKPSTNSEPKSQTSSTTNNNTQPTPKPTDKGKTPDKGKKPNKKSSLVKRAYDSAKKTVSDAGKETGKTAVDVVDKAYNKLNNKDHIKK